MDKFPEGKYLATVKIGPKGQIVIPKEVRDMFDLKSGDSLVLMADKSQGIALQPYSYLRTFWDAVNQIKDMDDEKKMNALIVENLTKKYPSFSLDKVSFSVANGHIAGLIGANGAGKSTIIKSILQLVSASGKITVFGKDISDNEIAIKQLIGFVGGGFRFYPMKKLSSVRKIYAAFYPAWNQEKYNNYLLQFNISESKRVKELSDGMKIKFALALALSHGAKLLILDEPTSGLDPLSREEFCDIMLALVNSEHVSILFSTHITSDLMRIADDVIYISRGRVLADCPLRELTARYSIGVFDTLQQAEDAKAIGIKSVKSGYEGLLLCNSSAMNANAKKATLDDIMIHLEIAAKRK